MFNPNEYLNRFDPKSKQNNFFGMEQISLESALEIIDAEYSDIKQNTIEQLVSWHINSQYANAFKLSNSLYISKQHSRDFEKSWYAYFRYWNARRAGEPQDLLSKLKSTGEALQRRLKNDSLHLEWTVEWARVEMHSGRYPVAVHMIEDFLEQQTSHNYSLYTIYRMYLCLGTCYQAMAQYSKSWHAISIQAKIISVFPSQLLQIQMLRRKASHYVESEKFESAEKFLISQEKYFQTRTAPLQTVQFFQEKLRLALLRGQYQRVDSLLVEVTDMVHKHKLPLSILNMDVERCEVEMLVEANLSGLQARFTERLKQNKSNQNDATVAVIHFLLSRIALRLGKYARASNHVQLSLEFCHKWKYGRFGALCLLLNSVIFLKQKNTFEALSFCMKGLKDTAQKKLILLNCCFEIHLANIQRVNFPFEKICRTMIQASEFCLRDIFHAVNQLSIQWPMLPGLEWKNQTQQFNLNQSDGVEQFFVKLDEMIQAGSLFFIHESQKIIWFENSKASEIILTDTEFEILKILIDANNIGIKLEEIHRICYFSVKYDADKHRARSAMMLTRLGEKLAPCALVIKFSRAVDSFVLNQNSLLLSLKEFTKIGIPVSASTHFSNFALTERQRDLMRCIEDEISISSIRLRTKLFITRQSLHQLLAPLVKKGLVLKTGIGKATRYKMA